jgi:uncharacterized Zn finger protein
MSMNLYCPNCGEDLGKVSELEADYEDCKKNNKIDVQCGNCGEIFKHRCLY